MKYFPTEKLEKLKKNLRKLGEHLGIFQVNSIKNFLYYKFYDFMKTYDKSRKKGIIQENL